MSSTYSMTSKQVASKKRQRKSIRERERKSSKQEKRSAEAWSTTWKPYVKQKRRLAKTGKMSVKHMITSSMNGSTSKWTSNVGLSSAFWDSSWAIISHNTKFPEEISDGISPASFSILSSELLIPTQPSLMQKLCNLVMHINILPTFSRWTWRGWSCL